MQLISSIPAPRSRRAAPQPAPMPSITPASADVCAGNLLEIMPRLMRTIRTLMSQADSPHCTVPQFRALFYVSQHIDASLSSLAEFLGLTLPAASRQVEQLVKRRLVSRRQDAADHRRMTLRLTTAGDALLKTAQESVRLKLAATLSSLDDSNLALLDRALTILQDCFPPLGGNAQQLSTPSRRPSRKSQEFTRP